MHGVNPYPVSVIGILPLPESGGKDTKMTDVMNCVDKLLEKITGYKQRMAVNPKRRNIRSLPNFRLFTLYRKFGGYT